MNPSSSPALDLNTLQHPVPKKKSGAWMMLLIIFAGFLFTCYQLFWDSYERDRLIERGVAATALILSADPTGSTYNSQPEVRLRLRVTPKDGQIYEAQSILIVNPIYVPQFQPGKTVNVRYDANDRSKVAVEERN